MSTETELFLRKTKELSELVSAMKSLSPEREPELLAIERKLADLSIAVEKDKCLNAGGKFEWVDSVLVKCLRNGTWLLLDQANLFNAAILDRLNGLLEPNGVLTISERGVDEQGNVYTVKPHKNFRLFLTMDPQYGEISRAMRNRGIEIITTVPALIPAEDLLDTRSLMNKFGVSHMKRQDTLYKIEEYLYSKTGVNNQMQAISIIGQKITKGFSFEQSLRNYYLESYGSSNYKCQEDAAYEIVDSMCSFLGDGAHWHNCNSIRLNAFDVQRNSMLAVIEQQGFLLRSAMEMLKHDCREINLDLFRKPPLTGETTKMMKLLLLNFYEKSSFVDKDIRHAWCLSVCQKNGFAEFEKLAQVLYETVCDSIALFQKNSNAELPLAFQRTNKLANNLAIALYLRMMIFECQSDTEIRRLNDASVVRLTDFSTADCRGALANKPKNKPLFDNYTELMNNAWNAVRFICCSEHLLISDVEYLQLRDNLKQLQELQSFGNTELNLANYHLCVRTTYAELEYRYKWLTNNFFKTLITLVEKSPCDHDARREWENSFNVYVNAVTSVHKFDYFWNGLEEIRLILSPIKPHSTTLRLSFEKFLITFSHYMSLTDEDLTSFSRARFKLYLLETSLSTSMCDQPFYDDVQSDIVEAYHISRTNDSDLPDKIKYIIDGSYIEPKLEKDKLRECIQELDETSLIEIWPIYECFFMIFAYNLQRKLSEKCFNNLFVEDEDTIIEILCRLNKNDSLEHVEHNPHDVLIEWINFISNIHRPVLPTRIEALLKCLYMGTTNSSQVIILLFEFLSLIEEFSQRTFAIRNNDDIAMRFFGQSEDENKNGDKNKNKNEDEDEDEDGDGESNSNSEHHVLSDAYFFSTSSLWKLYFKYLVKPDDLHSPKITIRNSFRKEKELNILHKLLWSNSFTLFSEEFKVSSNDSTLLRNITKFYMSAINQGRKDCEILNKEGEQMLETHCFAPLKSLQEITKKLETSYSAVERGKGWLILGQLQLFIFKDLENVDIMDRNDYALKCILKNISDLKQLMLIEELQNMLQEVRLSRHQDQMRINYLNKLSQQKKNYVNVSVCRSPYDYLDLKDEIENFTRIIGSTSTIWRHMKALLKVAEEMERGEFTDLTWRSLQEAKLWRKSLRQFWYKLEKRYFGAYQDIVSPIITGISSLHRGVSILLQHIVSLQQQYNNWQFCYHSLRFPSSNVVIDNYSRMINFCTTDVAVLLPHSSKHTFKMLMVALRELENLSTVVAGDVWSIRKEYNKVFEQILNIWKRQENLKQMHGQLNLFKLKSEEEENQLDYQRMFPSYQQDFLELAKVLKDFQQEFPVLQKPLEIKVSKDNESFEVISLKDAQEIVRIHQNMLNNWQRGHGSSREALMSKSKNSTNHLKHQEPDFINPLAERFQLIGHHIEKLPEQSSSELLCTMSVLISKKMNFGIRNKDIYDFYKDPNVTEVLECREYLTNHLTKNVNLFLIIWPENPILNSIKMIIQRLLDFPIESPLSRFLVGIELLMTKMQQWEENATCTHSLINYIEFFGRKVLEWRKLELCRCEDSLEILEDDLKAETAKWWFFLFDLVNEYLKEGSEIQSKTELVTALDNFFKDSSLIQFESRLQLVYLFCQHICAVVDHTQKVALSGLFWNVFNYYSLFLYDVTSHIKKMKDPIAKKVKDTIKITRWCDFSYWSVKQTAEKVRRTLHKLMKEHQKNLQQKVVCYTLKARPELLSTIDRKDQSPANFLIQLGTGKLSKTEKLAGKARQFCEDIFNQCNYPQIRNDIEIFIEDSLEESKKLRSLEVDKTLTKGKQQSQLKSILQQKKMALSNYFKSLSKLGLSYRTGIFAWKKDTVNIEHIPVLLNLEIMELFQFANDLNENLDKMLLDQWSSCKKYYFESMIKLKCLDHFRGNGRRNIGIQNTERCQGFSVHLFLLANKQKLCITELLNLFVPIRFTVWNLSLIMDNLLKGDNATESSSKIETPSMPKQDVFKTIVQDFQKLLISLEISMKQIIVYLETYPREYNFSEYCLANDQVIDTVKVKVMDTIEQINDSLKVIVNIAQIFNKWFVVSKKCKKGSLLFLYHIGHIDFLITSYQKINEVKGKLVNASSTFIAGHPVTENLCYMVDSITKSTEQFQSIIYTSTTEELEQTQYVENYEKYLDELIKNVLLAIQKKVQTSQKLDKEKDIEKVAEEDFEKNLMSEGLINSLKTAIDCLGLDEIYSCLTRLVLIIYHLDSKSANYCIRSLLKYLPLLKQYILFVHYYLDEQMASFRLTCKFLYLQLGVFLDLTENGFCQPLEGTANPEDNQDGGPSEGGMGLADGEGKKDVSDRIESEDQLEDTTGPNEEKQDSEEGAKEEDNGIEMSENFDSRPQDLESEEEENDDEDQDLDKEMGDVDSPEEKVDEELWKDDEEEEGNEGDQSQGNKQEKKGNGEETGEQEMGANDGNENKDRNEDGETEQGSQKKEEEKKEIDEFKEPEIDDDQIDPYHGKQQPEIEPEAFDLSENIDLDDEMEDEKENEKQEENPFDIDQIKESKIPEEMELEESKGEEEQEEDERMNDDDDDDTDIEEDPRTDNDKKDGVETSTEEDKANDMPEQAMEEDNNKPEEENAPASLDKSSKEVDASQEVESRKDGSRDAVGSQSNEKEIENSAPEISADDKKDEGTGQAQTEKRQGHSGAEKEENASTSGEKKSFKPIKKRRKPGQSDENRSLLDNEIPPCPKKLKTGLMREAPNDSEEKENDAENAGANETYQHIKQSEKFDDMTFDAATEEQIKQQASNMEDKEKMDDKLEDDDVQMHEDPMPEEQENKVEKEQSSKVHESKKEKSTRGMGEKSDIIEEIEVEGEIEGDIVETSRVLRGSESTFHTNLSETQRLSTFTDATIKERSEIADMLDKCSKQSSSSNEAGMAWYRMCALTASAARHLSEKLRLILEPTLTSRLKGDYRTGKRINMRKVIPYIASEFRKDKIWLRRTKPSKRDYQIVLAIDDSSSMADNHSKELAFESLSLIGQALTYLEAGKLSIISFGERVDIVHPFGANLTVESGTKLINEMKFDQKKTMISQMLHYAVDMFTSQGSSADSAKLLTILSDGRGIFSEGMEKVNTAVRRAKLLNIFLVFIIVDNPLNKNSILDIRMPVFENGKLQGIRSYMDNFPFPFYIILRDLDALPTVLSDALRQWFEIVGKIDS